MICLKIPDSSPSRSFWAEGRRKTSATALQDVLVKGNGLKLGVPQGLHIEQILFQLFARHLFDDGFLDEKAVLDASFPAEFLDSFCDSVIHFNGKGGFLIFHGFPIIPRQTNKIKKKLIKVILKEFWPEKEPSFNRKKLVVAEIFTFKNALFPPFVQRKYSFCAIVLAFLF